MTSLRYPCPSLDAPKSQIRLLEINPQSDLSLQYSLRTFDIKNSPPYIALSYTWGDDEPVNTIFINGQTFRIRDNLSYALPRLASLRSGDKPEFRRDETYFWIDAICINQESTEERNHQVSIMADIFTTAALTVAWLGPEDENFQFLTSIVLKNPGHSSTFDQLPVNEESRLLAQPFLEKIASKEYFTRMWIIQEIVLSQEVFVMCGSGICAWQTLQDYWLSYLNIFDSGNSSVQRVIGTVSKNATRDPLAAFHSIMSSRLIRDELHFRSRLDELVHLYFYKKCRDPRDRIYALLGLLPLEALQSNPIPVDYEISREALFLLVRKHFHLHKSSLTGDTFRARFDYAGDLQKALGITTAFRFQCESRLIEEGFFWQI